MFVFNLFATHATKKSPKNLDACSTGDWEIIGKYNFKDVSKICLHLFLSFCLLWICIFMKDIWYKCKYQSCFQLFYPVLIREILRNFFLVEMYLTFALQYLSKLDPTVKMVSNGKILWQPKAMPAPFETEED